MIVLPYAFIILTISQSTATVEVEETVATCAPPGNGAGPFWCYGAPLMFRLGQAFGKGLSEMGEYGGRTSPVGDVFVSAMETGEDVEPLCNTRWRLFRKQGDGEWEMAQSPGVFREREPCPLIGFPDGRLFLSVNPSTQPPGTKYGNCEPQLLQFSAAEPEKHFVSVRPVWDEDIYFTDHSYRGIAADGERGEILLLNIHARSGDQFWSFCNADGEWVRHGSIHFPIRSCYPQLALRDRAGHVLAIGDIVEPNEEWRTHKFEKTGRSWDYVFRRLFYTYAPDITGADFVEPIEVDNVDATAGHIRNLDMWIDDDGAAHILYLKQTVQSALMRDRFFPDVPINTSLEYVVMQNGEVVEGTTLLKGGEKASSEVPGNARFHVTGDGRLLMVYYCVGRDADGNAISENRLLQILPEGDNEPVSIGLQEPFGTFFTATERGGSARSDILDLFGSGRDNTLRYARIRLK